MIDLHLHSRYSDGTWSPRELVEHAVKIGLKHIALSDHDTTDGIAEARAAAAGRIEIIDAVEISCMEAGRNVHILGYFIDPDNHELKSLLLKQKEARERHLSERIERISAGGVKITEESVRACVGGSLGVLGTAHITEAIVRAGGAPDITSAWETFLKPSSPYYVERRSITPLMAVAAIRRAGGIASIAHPGGGEDVNDRRCQNDVIPLIESLLGQGLGALEAYHRVHDDAMREFYAEFAARRGLLTTGGSDCHGPYEEYPSTMGSIKLPAGILDALRRGLNN